MVQELLVLTNRLRNSVTALRSLVQQNLIAVVKPKLKPKPVTKKPAVVVANAKEIVVGIVARMESHANIALKNPKK